MARALRSGVSSKVDMPITPMLDMTFQLLAFFILTFQPQAALEGKLEFSLPANPQPVGTAEPLTGIVPEPPDEQADLAQMLTLVVKTAHDGLGEGNIKDLILESEGGPVALPDLDSLRQALKQRQPQSGKAQIKIAAESRLKYACVMEVMDVCLKSGFTNVGFVPPPDLH